MHHFINEGGKFLYCTKIEEVIYNLQNIIKENKWDTISCNDIDLLKLSKEIEPITINHDLKKDNPIYYLNELTLWIRIIHHTLKIRFHRCCSKTTHKDIAIIHPSVKFR